MLYGESNKVDCGLTGPNGSDTIGDARHAEWRAGPVPGAPEINCEGTFMTRRFATVVVAAVCAAVLGAVIGAGTASAESQAKEQTEVSNSAYFPYD